MNVNTPFPELDSVLSDLISGIIDILSDNFVGAYLQGSLAVGDFDRHSDVDFIIVIENELNESQVQGLQLMHKRIFYSGPEWAKHLEGSYFPKDVLGDYRNHGKSLWYLDNGHSELERSDHCNSIVVRWILREKGVIILGPDPKELINPVPTNILRNAIYTSIIKSGHEILNNRELYNNRFYQTFIVLQYCRKLHDLYAGVVSSKRTGAEWARQNLDKSWIDLIDRTWAGRPNPAFTVRQPADKDDYKRTLKFVQEIMYLAKSYAVKHNIHLDSRDRLDL